MEESQDDVFARLNAAIEDWNTQLATSHNRLTEKITSAREHLREMIDAEEGETETLATTDTASALAAALEEAASLRANLTDAEARIEALEAELDGARTALELHEAAETNDELDLEFSSISDETEDDNPYAEELAELREQFSAVQEELTAVQGALDASKARVRNLLEEQKETIALRGEVELLRSQLESKEEALALDAAERRAIEAEEKASNLNNDKKTLEAEKAALLAHLEDLKQERDNAVKALEDAKQTASRTLSGAARVSSWMAEEAKSTTPRLDADPFLEQHEEKPEKRPISTRDERGHRKRMGEILVDAGLISQEQLEFVLKEQKEKPQKRIGAIVVEKGFSDEESIAHVLAAQLGMPYVDLGTTQIDAHAVTVLTGKMARAYLCVPIMRQMGMGLRVAFANPLDLIAMEDVERATGCKVEPVVATPTAIDAVLRKYFPNVR